MSAHLLIRDLYRYLSVGNMNKPETVMSVVGVMFKCLTFTTGLMELIHKAAFRDTLGRSLYMSEDRIGSFTPEHVNSLTHALTINHVLMQLLVTTIYSKLLLLS